MNKLEDILKIRNEEIKNRANEATEREIKRKAAEIIRQKELNEELNRKETEKIKSKELERITSLNRRKKEVLKSVFENVLIYGFIGLIIGAVFGFGKGCVSYETEGLYSKSFWEPFKYITGNALTIGIIGVLIGIFVGINKGQNSIK